MEDRFNRPEAHENLGLEALNALEGAVASEVMAEILAVAKAARDAGHWSPEHFSLPFGLRGVELLADPSTEPVARVWLAVAESLALTWKAEQLEEQFKEE